MSRGAVSISTRFLILAALAKSSRVSLKSSLFSIETPAAWRRSVPAEHEKHPFSASCKAVHSVSNMDKSQPVLWPCTLYVLPEFVASVWNTVLAVMLCTRIPVRSEERRGQLLKVLFSSTAESNGM